MMRLRADADPERWVPVTGSLGWRGRRHRKAAIRMLLAQASGGLGAEPRPGTGFAAWAMSQVAPLALRRADGRVLVWVWRDAPEVLVALAQVQEATPQLRAARAMMPMEYDDTEEFRNPHLGVGEKLVVPLPSGPGRTPFATYTWDAGTHLVTLTAVGGDRERFGTVVGALDELARTLRLDGDVTIGEAGSVLRIDPA